MKKLLLVLFTLEILVSSCEEPLDAHPFEYNTLCVYSQENIKIKYYIDGKESIEECQSQVVTQLFKTKKDKDIPLFVSVDSLIITNDNLESVVSKKGENTTRNLLQKENYSKSDEGRGTCCYGYSIDSKYFIDTNYVNPLLVDNLYNQ